MLNLNGNGAIVSSITVLTGPKTVGTGATAGIINTSATPSTVTFTYAGNNDNPSTLNNCNITDSSASGGSTTALTVASGFLTLGGNDTYGGVTTVNNGATLQFGITSTAAPTGTTYPSGGNTVNNGTLILNDSVTVGTITGSGTTTVTAGQNVVATSISQAGGVENEGNLSIFSGGTIGKITETGTAGAVAVYGGMLQLAPNGAPSSQSVLYIASGAVLDITNNKLFINYGTGARPDRFDRRVDRQRLLWPARSADHQQLHRGGRRRQRPALWHRLCRLGRSGQSGESAQRHRRNHVHPVG